jgi:hypothetical protein
MIFIFGVCVKAPLYKFSSSEVVLLKVLKIIGKKGFKHFFLHFLIREKRQSYSYNLGGL